MHDFVRVAVPNRLDHLREAFARLALRVVLLRHDTIEELATFTQLEGHHKMVAVQITISDRGLLGLAALERARVDLCWPPSSSTELAGQFDGSRVARADGNLFSNTDTCNRSKAEPSRAEDEFQTGMSHS